MMHLLVKQAIRSHYRQRWRMGVGVNIHGLTERGNLCRVVNIHGEYDYGFHRPTAAEPAH